MFTCVFVFRRMSPTFSQHDARISSRVSASIRLGCCFEAFFQPFLDTRDLSCARSWVQRTSECAVREPSWPGNNGFQSAKKSRTPPLAGPAAHRGDELQWRTSRTICNLYLVAYDVMLSPCGHIGTQSWITLEPAAPPRQKTSNVSAQE